MTKADLISGIASATCLKKTEVAEVLKQLEHEVKAALYRGEDVVLPGLGKFAVAERAARSGRNPATGAVLDIPARKVPTFKALQGFRDFIAHL
jgi:DNA-binding protein HU-beta